MFVSLRFPIETIFWEGEGTKAGPTRLWGDRGCDPNSRACCWLCWEGEAGPGPPPDPSPTLGFLKAVWWPTADSRQFFKIIFYFFIGELAKQFMSRGKFFYSLVKFCLFVIMICVLINHHHLFPPLHHPLPFW